MSKHPVILESDTATELKVIVCPTFATKVPPAEGFFSIV